MPLDLIPLPTVHRVPHDQGSDIEPSLDATWPEAQRLAWHAAVVAIDTGLDVRLWSRAGDDDPHLYGVAVNGPHLSSSHSAFDFDDMWIMLNGISVGARAARGVHDAR
jgi:hypothetical protein